MNLRFFDPGATWLRRTLLEVLITLTNGWRLECGGGGRKQAIFFCLGVFKDLLMCSDVFLLLHWFSSLFVLSYFLELFKVFSRLQLFVRLTFGLWSEANLSWSDWFCCAIIGLWFYWSIDCFLSLVLLCLLKSSCVLWNPCVACEELEVLGVWDIDFPLWFTTFRDIPWDWIQCVSSRHDPQSKFLACRNASKGKSFCKENHPPPAVYLRLVLALAGSESQTFWWMWKPQCCSYGSLNDVSKYTEMRSNRRV